MTTQQIESSIVDRLDGHIEDLAVKAMPNDVRGYFPTRPVGEALVQYEASDFDPPTAIDSATQVRRPKVTVLIFRRDLRGHAGIYPAMDAVRDRLVGFAPPGCSKIYAVSDRFVNENAGLWTYKMMFTMQTIYEETGG